MERSFHSERKAAGAWPTAFCQRSALDRLPRFPINLSAAWRAIGWMHSEATQKIAGERIERSNVSARIGGLKGGEEAAAADFAQTKAKLDALKG